MKAGEWFRPPRAVLTLFIGLMTVCGLGLGWLGWQVLVQDRAVEAQRRQDQLEAAAALNRVLASSDAQLTLTTAAEVKIAPPGGLAYVPAQPPAPLSPEIFADAEQQEFAKQDLAKAAEAYRRLTQSAEMPVRAAASRPHDSSIWRIPANGGAAEQVFAAKSIGRIDISPDGRRLVYGGGDLARTEYWELDHLETAWRGGGK